MGPPKILVIFGVTVADALGSGPSGGNSMEVQVLLTAPEFHGRQPKNSRGHA